MSLSCWVWQEMWWGRLFLFSGLWPGCRGWREVCSCRFSCCANLHFLLSCRSLLRQLQKLQALVRQSAPKTTRRKTCTMVSGFKPQCLWRSLCCPHKFGREVFIASSDACPSPLLRSLLIFLFPDRGSVLLPRSVPQHPLTGERRATAGAQG